MSLSANFFEMEDLVKLMPGYVYLLDIHNLYRGCSVQQAKSFGLNGVQDIVGKCNKELPIFAKHQHLAEMLDHNNIKVMRDANLHPTEFEEEICYVNSEIAVFKSYKTPIFDRHNKVIGLLCTSFDVTKNIQELNELNLKFSKQSDALDSILAHLPGHVYWVDSNNCFLGCNDQQAYDFKLRSRHEIIGLSVRSFQTPENAATIIRNNNKVIQYGKTITEEENFKNLDGKDVAYLSKKVPIKNKQGEITGLLGISLDITAQKEAERLKIENEKHQAKAEADKKYRDKIDHAIHDLGSPLSSLKNAVQFTQNMTEQERKVVIAAMNSINDISYGLLSDYHADMPDNQKPQDMLLSAVLLQEISNKRHEYKDSGVEFIDNIDLKANFAFIRTEPSDFRRMVSNLINNAVDALENRDNKQIKIELSQNTIDLILTIEDNGKGMPQDLIDSINNKTHKSYDKKNGHGLGWRQIRDTIERNLGRFSIGSSEDEWTIINMYFPLVRTPSWVACEIKIIKGDTIVVVDDEPSVHIAWDTKLAPLMAKMPTLAVRHFTFGADAIKFLSKLTDKEKQKICLLTDYELLNQKFNGLDIIEQTWIKRATLVTSHYADFKIRERAKKSRIKILPKDLTFAVHITLDKKIRAGSKKVDMVWIDDNLPWMEGLIEDHYSTLKVDKYEEPVSFLEDVKAYPLNTKIVLDMFYTNAGVWQLDGFDVARKLHEMGYNNLYMAAGETIKRRIPNYLKVIYKDDVKGLSTLDKL